MINSHALSIGIARRKETAQIKPFTKIIISLLIAFFMMGGFGIIWLITLPLPDFNAYFTETGQAQSTKIYDRTGTNLLYDLHGTVKRTVVPFNEISQNIKNATIAIEDADFYKHKGIKFTSIARSLFTNLTTGQATQGGSTITQQLVKNTLLTNEKSITRKLKEAVLAIKLESTMSKDDILNLYLNEIPYGGNIYGVQEAAQTFFQKNAKDLTLAESAYIAAIPQAPTHFSPYGNYKNDLENRKNLVLTRMREVGYITKEQETTAKKEKVVFSKPENKGLNAPHFVFFIKSYLENKYGSDVLEKGGLKVTTTLDWNMQKKSEEIVKKYGETNQKNFNANNAGVVAIDPKTGQILVMVGSRDYFNTAIDGNYNIALAKRQPGSSFKPIVYATAFNKGYTPDTVLFDLPTQFNTRCSAYGTPLDAETKKTDCYMPSNFDDQFVGPISLRDALGQSRNIPAIKTLYLAGINDSLATARKMGITTLGNANQYGLTLVLGGGEVSLLELTSAYSTFANDGIHNPYVSILKVEDANGNVLEQYQPNPEQVLPANTARLISSVLSDEKARGPNPNTYEAFPGRDVAAKTGTTNDYRDAWLMGYTPNIAVGAWVGNSDNKPMVKKVAGYIVTPMWHDVIQNFINTQPNESFVAPDPTPANIKPILRGAWQNNIGAQAPYNVHSILYWINKSDPTGNTQPNPNDPQFALWETPILRWAAQHGFGGGAVPSAVVPQVTASTSSATR